MIVESSTIARAFERHRWRYAKRERAWDLGYHVELWRRARAAFEEDSEADFEYLYEQLRRVWQAFRGGASRWDRSQVFESLRSLDKDLRALRLRALLPTHLDVLWKLLQEVQGLKMNTDGPSIVAVSKFLHFWNPRLFVIVDQGVMWNWVLSHRWLWDEVKAVREDLDQRLFGGPRKRNDATCDLSSYLAILIWSGGLLRANPNISTRFWRYIKSYEGVLPEVATYDAAAVEWFLLGLVELPPAGVKAEGVPVGDQD